MIWRAFKHLWNHDKTRKGGSGAALESARPKP
jgi:hypothetical protein